jgi:hypothetical protein
MRRTTETCSRYSFVVELFPSWTKDRAVSQIILYGSSPKTSVLLEAFLRIQEVSASNLSPKTSSRAQDVLSAFYRMQGWNFKFYRYRFVSHPFQLINHPAVRSSRNQVSSVSVMISLRAGRLGIGFRFLADAWIKLQKMKWIESKNIWLLN